MQDDISEKFVECNILAWEACKSHRNNYIFVAEKNRIYSDLGTEQLVRVCTRHTYLMRKVQPDLKSHFSAPPLENSFNICTHNILSAKSIKCDFDVDMCGEFSVSHVPFFELVSGSTLELGNPNRECGPSSFHPCFLKRIENSST